MDRQLASAPLIRPIGSPTKSSSADTYSQLSLFLHNLAPSPARTQIERLADALGVEIGAIAPSEGDRREADRVAKRVEAKRRKREEEEVRAREEMEGLVEGLEGERVYEGDIYGAGDENGEDEKEDEEGMDEGGVRFEGDDEVGMAGRGDVEYGDDLEEEDEDEPDNAGEKMDQDEED